MSVLSRLFSRKDPREIARAAYDRIIAMGRAPYWYLDGKVEDSVDGRFEAVTMVLAAVLLLSTKGILCFQKLNFFD